MSNGEILNAKPNGDLVVNDTVCARGKDTKKNDLSGFHSKRAQRLTSYKISCREPTVHATQHTSTTADTPSVNDRLARGQLHRLVRRGVSFIMQIV